MEASNKGDFDAEAAALDEGLEIRSVACSHLSSKSSSLVASSASLALAKARAKAGAAKLELLT